MKKEVVREGAKRSRFYLYVFVVFVLFFSVFVSAIDVTTCTSLVTNNAVYDLKNDLNASSTVWCLSFYANNSIINGNGFTIRGNATQGSTYGIYFDNGHNNITITNVTFVNVGYPIYTASTTNVYLTNSNVANCVGGIFPNNANRFYVNVNFTNVTINYGSSVAYWYNLNNVNFDKCLWNITASAGAQFYDNVSDVTIKNSTKTMSYITFRNSTNINFIYNTNFTDVRLSNVTNVNYSHNIFNNADTGLLTNVINNNTNYTISNNIILGSNSTTSLFNLGSVNNTRIFNNVFGSSGNYLNSTGSGGVIYTAGSNDFLLYNNTAYVGNYTAFVVGQSVGDSNITIDSNSVWSNSANSSGMAFAVPGESTCSQGQYNSANLIFRNNYVNLPVTANGRHDILIKCTNNSLVYNNTVIGGGYNFVLKDSNNMSFYNNSLIDGPTSQIHVKGMSNSFFYNNVFSGATSAPIVIWWDNLLNISGLNNVFSDMNLSDGLNPQINVVANASTSQRFINVTIRNMSALSVGNGSTSGVNNVSFWWYYYFSSNQLANFTIYNSTNGEVYQLNNSIGSNTNLKEFDNIDGAYTYQGNYTISAKYAQQTVNHSYNLSLTKNILNDGFTFPILVSISSPQNTSYNNRTQLLNISSDGVSILYNWNGTNYSYSSPINVTFTEGINTLVVYSNDSLGAVNSSNVTFYIDSIFPNVTLVSPINSYSETSSSTILNFQFNVSDDSEISNCTLYLNGVSYSNTSAVNKSAINIIPISVTPSSYSWYVNCTDSLLNIGNSSNNTLTIVMPEEVQASNGGGSPTLYASVENLITGYSKILLPHWQVKFTIGSASHSLYLNNVSNNSATITVSSTPQVITLKIGEEKKLSLTNSSYYDLYVKLNSIYQSKANFTIKTINEKIVVENKSIQEISEEVPQVIKEEERSFAWAWILVLVLIVLVGIFILLKKHRK